MNNSSHINVLVFDESEVYRTGLCSSLAGEAKLQRVIQADTRSECLRAYAHYCPEVVVIVINDSISTVSELTRSLRSGDFQTPILMMGQSDEHWLEALTWKANGCLPLSVSKDILVRTIEDLCKGKLVFGPAFADVTRFEAELTRKFELSSRELDVLRFMTLGTKDKDIADILGLSPHTVRNHVRHVLYKLGCKRKFDVVTRGLHQGYVVHSPMLSGWSHMQPG